MKSVLISIRPHWCEKIVNGEKTIEVRKTAPKEVPFKAFIYCTKTKNKWSLCDYEGAYQNSKGEIVYAQQHIIGEFICDKITKYRYTKPWLYNGKSIYHLPIDTINTCLSYEEIEQYLGNKDGYGLHITALKIYDKPRALREFFKPCPDKFHYCEICKYGSVILSSDEEEYALYHGGNYDTYETVCCNRVTRPPQSWCYVEEFMED